MRRLACCRQVGQDIAADGRPAGLAGLTSQAPAMASLLCFFCVLLFRADMQLVAAWQGPSILGPAMASFYIE